MNKKCDIDRNVKIFSLLIGLLFFFSASIASANECHMTYAREYSSPEMALKTWGNSQLRKIMSTALQCTLV